MLRNAAFGENLPLPPPVTARSVNNMSPLLRSEIFDPPPPLLIENRCFNHNLCDFTAYFTNGYNVNSSKFAKSDTIKL